MSYSIKTGFDCIKRTKQQKLPLWDRNPIPGGGHPLWKHPAAVVLFPTASTNINKHIVK